MLSTLDGLANLDVVGPLDYSSFSVAMSRSYLVLTDCVGVQEEAPSLGVPILLFRGATECYDGVEAGTAFEVGSDTHRIVAETQRLSTIPSLARGFGRSTTRMRTGRQVPELSLQSSDSSTEQLRSRAIGLVVREKQAIGTSPRGGVSSQRRFEVCDYRNQISVKRLPRLQSRPRFRTNEMPLRSGEAGFRSDGQVPKT